MGFKVKKSYLNHLSQKHRELYKRLQRELEEHRRLTSEAEKAKLAELKKLEENRLRQEDYQRSCYYSMAISLNSIAN